MSLKRKKVQLSNYISSSTWPIAHTRRKGLHKERPKREKEYRALIGSSLSNEGMGGFYSIRLG